MRFSLNFLNDLRYVIVILLLLLFVDSYGQDRKPGPVLRVNGASQVNKMPDTGILMLSLNYIGLDVTQTMSGLEKKLKP